MHLVEFFDRGALINRDGVAFTRPDGSHALTYAQAQDLSHRVAAALRDSGLGEGSAVAVLSGNSTLVFPVVLGVLRSGATWVALNPRSGRRDIVDLLRTVAADGLLYCRDLGGMAQQIAGQVPTLKLTLSFHSQSCPDAFDWLPAKETRVPLPRLDPEGVAALFGTGGTTGRAKAVEIPHRAFETMIHGLNTCMPEHRPVHLVAAPMTHAAGALVFPVLSAGGTNVVHDAVHPQEILRSIADNRVTRLFLPPTAIYGLLAHPGVREADTSTLRYLIYGAAPMSVDKLKEALGVFGPVMAQFYGQVEAPMICAFLTPDQHAEALANPSAAHRLSSCGQPTTAAHVAIMDDEGNLLPAGQRGEVVVRSSLVMRGYRGDPERTAETTRGGWHATGDVGYLDDGGFLYLVDRKRDLIISGGFNVFPSEVEQVIWAHPSVTDCAVIGLPDEKWGERVTAVVELKPGRSATSEELIELCKQRLGSVKAPKEVIFRDLPRSPVGKVLKRDLRNEYWSGKPRLI